MRIFLVGAARSGTTLLQSMIAAHSQVHSFPETHFFTLVPRSGKKQYIVPLGEKQREKVKVFLEEVGRSDLIHLLPKATYSKKKWARGLIQILDELTIQSGHHMWLEKTPLHLYYIDLITKAASGTQFIHMIRDGQDVVASTYDATRKYPEDWGGPRSIDQCVARWTHDVELSRKYLGRPDHVFIRYEELVASPESQLKRICSELGLRYEERMLEFQRGAEGLIYKEELWKKHNVEEIQKRSKFKAVFTEDEQQQVLDLIEGLSLEDFSSA
jgi:hypothetical protein